MLKVLFTESVTRYQVFDKFEYYDITGDAGDWLALQRIPSISIELATHESVGWEQNLPGIMAVLDNYNTQQGDAGSQIPLP